MRRLPKLQQVKVFQEVIRRGSIRAAARALNLSQPAISRTLRELEMTLETTLLTRSAQGIEPTLTGHAFAIRAQVILEELQRAGDEIQFFNEATRGAIAMGCSSLLALTVFPQAVETFRQCSPQASIRVREAQLSTLLSALREGSLDFAIGSFSSHLPLESFNVEPLFRVPFCILARVGHPYTNATQLQQLCDAKWLIPDTDMGYYRLLETEMGEFWQQLRIPPLRTDSFICGLKLVQDADYLTIVAHPTQHSFGDTLQTLKIEGLPVADYAAVWSKKSPLTASAQYMLDILRHTCREYHWDQAVPSCATTSKL